MPPGTIYFQPYYGTGPYWSMNGDGSNKVQSTGRMPTDEKHGGSRWFVQNRTVEDTGPDQWFAVNEAGDAVQLTDDPDLRWNGYPPALAKNDSSFSICCDFETPLEWIG